MIVHAATGIVWRFFMGAILDAVERGALHASDARIDAIREWIATPGLEVCAVCGLDVGHVGECQKAWWR